MVMSSDELKPKANGNNFIDAAVFITMVTGAMYLLGFTYWVSFFRYFGIDKEFIDLGFEQMISTTWVFGLASIVAFLIFIGFDIFDIKKIEDYSYGIRNIIYFSYFMIGFVLIISFFLNYLSALHIIILFFVAMLILVILRYLDKRKPFFEKRIGFGKILHKKSNQFIIFIIILMSFVIIYFAFGIYSAEMRANHQNGARIILETSGGWQSPKDAVFITHMNNKYFIYNISNNNSNREVYIIEDSQTTKVILLMDNKHNYNLP